MCIRDRDNQGAATTVALWMPACDIYPSATTPSFPYNATYLAAHEMTHAFGAVPDCAPHADGTGHANDDNRDVVYGGNSQRDWDHITLDPGRDACCGHGRDDCMDIARSPFWTCRPLVSPSPALVAQGIEHRPPA